LYTEDIEDDTLKQLKVLAESGITLGHVSAMPDAHLGKGTCIGAVFASDRALAPSAVGVDIGCGMIAAPSRNLKKDNLSLDKLQQIQRMLKSIIDNSDLIVLLKC